MTRNRLKNGFLTITAPTWRQYSPRPLTYCPCPPSLLPLPTSSDYGLAVYPALYRRRQPIVQSRSCFARVISQTADGFRRKCHHFEFRVIHISRIKAPGETDTMSINADATLYVLVLIHVMRMSGCRAFKWVLFLLVHYEIKDTIHASKSRILWKGKQPFI